MQLKHSFRRYQDMHTNECFIIGQKEICGRFLPLQDSQAFNNAKLATNCSHP